MGRQAKKKAIPAADLLNFHFTSPATGESSSSNTRRQGNSNSGRNPRRQRQQDHRTAQDRASARRRASAANFYLHSSPNHSFVLTRRSNTKIQGSSAYSFSGCDIPVAWDSVRIVNHSIPVDPKNSPDEVSCPICLCTFVCPRVTKCGHSFCLPCILHHVQTYNASNPYSEIKCPCCSLPMSVEDLRPVIIRSIVLPRTQTFIRLRKLHRRKGCSAPYIPLPDAPKHSSPHAAPCQSDDDALFSRFNYVDPQFLHSLLEENRISLLQEMKSIPSDSTDYVFVAMGLEIVMSQLNVAAAELDEEVSLQHRYALETSGMYQRQSPSLVFRYLQEEGNGEMLPVNRNPDNFVQELPVQGRQRGESVGSYRSSEGSVSSKRSSNNDNLSSPKSGPVPGSPKAGTMYLDDDESIHFYQAEDGQLIFLSGFNLMCLSADFSKHRPGDGERTCPPLPDYVYGKILEVQNVHLTADVKKRMPFLDHLPLFSDVSFVEMDLNQLMSKETRTKFQPELAKRRKKRQNKVQAEKRADRAAKREEARQINERKARFNAIDPGDEFFHIQPATEEREVDHLQDIDVDPQMVSEEVAVGPQAARKSVEPGLVSQTFSDALRRDVNDLTLHSEESFPDLPSLESSVTKSQSSNELPRGLEKGQLHVRGRGKKKNSKAGKVVLFSTGGQRGYGY